MAIALVQRAGTVAVSGTPGGYSGDGVVLDMRFPSNVTAGNLIVIAVSRLQISLTDALIAGDVTQLAGTATIGTITLDRGHNYNYTGAHNIGAAVLSVPVTGTGSLDLRIATASGIYHACVPSEFSGTDVSGSRLDQVNSGEGASGAKSSGSITTTAGALIVGTMQGAGDNDNPTEDAAFTALYEQNSSANCKISAIYRVVTSSTTDAAEWAAGSSNQWVAAVASYKEAVTSTVVNRESTRRGVGRGVLRGV
jgi:hypothetical protein